MEEVGLTEDKAADRKGWRRMRWEMPGGEEEEVPKGQQLQYRPSYGQETVNTNSVPNAATSKEEISLLFPDAFHTEEITIAS
eukprot:gene12630-3336_t